MSIGEIFWAESFTDQELPTGNDILRILKEKFDESSNRCGYEYVRFCIPNDAYDLLFEEDKSLRKLDPSYTTKAVLEYGSDLDYLFFSVYPYSKESKMIYDKIIKHSLIHSDLVNAALSPKQQNHVVVEYTYTLLKTFMMAKSELTNSSVIDELAELSEPILRTIYSFYGARYSQYRQMGVALSADITEMLKAEADVEQLKKAISNFEDLSRELFKLEKYKDPI